MVPGAWRTGLNSAGFIRLLAELTAIDVPGSTQTVAERLGAWLEWTDAIPLSAALAAPARGMARTPPAPGVFAQATEACQRVRAELRQAITADALFAATATQGHDYPTYRHHHATHQRKMAARIGTLRADLRAMLARSSVALGRLAALDAVMDEILGPRERSLLARVPSLLEKRFEHLRQALPPAEWPVVFGQDMRNLLLAELALRCQPVEGLLAALDPQAPTHKEPQ
ncbi:MAG: DUF3348 domain-containing protein [Burkholderiales bacterium]|nr:DUF3348 domain-containing protein [Burkholderiales bacterium]